MDDQHLLVLFGDSLLMDTVEASLEKKQDVGVVRIRAAVPDVGALLKTLFPDLVIFDWDSPFSRAVVASVRELAGIPLLGLDVACKRVVVVSGEQYTVQTSVDLAEVISMHTAPRPRRQRCNRYALGHLEEETWPLKVSWNPAQKN